MSAYLDKISEVTTFTTFMLEMMLVMSQSTFGLTPYNYDRESLPNFLDFIKASIQEARKVKLDIGQDAMLQEEVDKLVQSKFTSSLVYSSKLKDANLDKIFEVVSSIFKVKDASSKLIEHIENESLPNFLDFIKASIQEARKVKLDIGQGGNKKE
ncbi:hypothetical protein LguiA_021660 [Lonicera macranthoides]